MAEAKVKTLKDSVQHKRVAKPPRVVLYGPEGIGKSTFGASAVKPIIQPTEDGLDEIDAPKFDKAQSFKEVMDNLRMLYREEHDFRSYALDTVDWLETLVWADVCERYGQDPKYGLEGKPGKNNPFGYGKGYTFAMKVWAEFFLGLDMLRNKKGMAIILIAHSEVKRYDSPDVEPYDRHVIKMHKQINAKMIEWCDALIFCNHKVFTEETDVGYNRTHVRGVGGTERVMHTEERPAFRAKNRYGLEPEIPFRKGEAWNEIMKGIKASRNK